MKAINSAFAIVLISAISRGDQSPSISSGAINEDGFYIHDVESPYQSGKTQIRVLRPSNIPTDQRLPVVYVLPVEAQGEHRYGDGLVEIQKHDLHNKCKVIFIAPTFSDLPWYADHPSNPAIRQETYFLNVVVPFVDRAYPVEAGPDGGLLLGFSKSGWGAWSLLLRHPELFDRAAAWDAPLMMDLLGKYGTTEIFESRENFELYRIDNLLRAKAISLVERNRLILTGYDSFQSHHRMAHSLLQELKIPHEYRDGPKRTHDWHSGWVPEAVELLFQESRE